MFTLVNALPVVLLVFLVCCRFLTSHLWSSTTWGRYSVALSHHCTASRVERVFGCRCLSENACVARWGWDDEAGRTIADDMPTSTREPEADTG